MSGGMEAQVSKDIELRRIFRRILVYGLRNGERINSVSMAAAGWYWQMHAVADDWGNLPGDPFLCRVEAAPRRRTLTDDEVAGWIRELMEATSGANGRPLIRSYTGDDGETYLHIVDFPEIQTTYNGRKARKYPTCPFEGGSGPKPGHSPGADPGEPDADGGPGGPADETGGSQMEPGATGLNAVALDPEPESGPQARARVSTTPPSRDLGAQGGVWGGNGRSGSGSCVGTVTEPERRLATSRALEQLGVSAAMSAHLSTKPGLTPEIVEKTRADILSGGGVRNATSVLVSRLKKGRFT